MFEVRRPLDEKAIPIIRMATSQELVDYEKWKLESKQTKYINK